MNSLQILFLAVVALVLHVVVAIASRKINVIFLLAGIFVVLSLLSVASGLSFVTVIKYARVYTTALMVVAGFAYYRIHGFQRSVNIFSLFLVVSLASPLWSVAPLHGIMYKSFFALTLLSGFFLGASLRTWKEAVTGLRYLTLLTLTGTAIAVVYFAPPKADLTGGRLVFLDINPGRVGGNAAAMLLLCGFVALYDRSRGWRLTAWAACALSATLIALSGNRTGAAGAALGMIVIAFPLLQRPRRFILVLVAALTLTALAFFYLGDTYGMQRMVSLENTRETQWYSNARIAAAAPIFGHGWIYTGPESGYANLHSLYFQILAEMGFVGLGLFVACLLPIILQWYETYRRVRHFPPGTEFVMLPVAFIVMTLTVGIFETGPLAGVMPDTLLFGFGISLIDRLPMLLKQQSRAAQFRPWARRLPAPGMG